MVGTPADNAAVSAKIRYNMLTCATQTTGQDRSTCCVLQVMARFLVHSLPFMAILAMAGFTHNVAADLIVTNDSVGDMQTIDASTLLLSSQQAPNKENRKAAFELPLDATSGGAAGAGFVSVVPGSLADLSKLCNVACGPSQSTSLEDRAVHLPASPVFDRLRPPRD